jgi:hypothetical protein
LFGRPEPDTAGIFGLATCVESQGVARAGARLGQRGEDGVQAIGCGFDSLQMWEAQAAVVVEVDCKELVTALERSGLQCF